MGFRNAWPKSIGQIQILDGEVIKVQTEENINVYLKAIPSITYHSKKIKQVQGLSKSVTFIVWKPVIFTVCRKAVTQMFRHIDAQTHYP